MVDPIASHSARAVAPQRGNLPPSVIDEPVAKVKDTSARTIASNAVTRMALQGAPVDEARVLQLRDSIASITYPLDPARIAEKMLEFFNPGVGR
ncbi:MAG: flagellar biosynthesis anti-sigma factor FlgM [Parasphingorhabdus sp.]|nr:flagellar biosynthesis anti-sigma factor FlgM [Parasphingorhabdus sp.]